MADSYMHLRDTINNDVAGGEIGQLCILPVLLVALDICTNEHRMRWHMFTVSEAQTSSLLSPATPNRIKYRSKCTLTRWLPSTNWLHHIFSRWLPSTNWLHYMFNRWLLSTNWLHYMLTTLELELWSNTIVRPLSLKNLKISLRILSITCGWNWIL